MGSEYHLAHWDWEGLGEIVEEDAVLASHEKYESRFNLEQGTISVRIDGGSAMDYIRTEDAVG